MKMSFTIFQNEITPFYSSKTRSSKSQKNRHFSKGVNPLFWTKNCRFSDFFLRNQAMKMSITIFQNEITPFYSIKTRSSKSRKIDIFANELTLGFGAKMTIFPSLFFQALQAMKMSFTIFYNKKTPFQAIKTRSSKSRKIDIFPKGLTHGFVPKMAIFPTFFFSQYRPEKCLLQYSRPKKRLSML